MEKGKKKGFFALGSLQNVPSPFSEHEEQGQKKEKKTREQTRTGKKRKKRFKQKKEKKRRERNDLKCCNYINSFLALLFFVRLFL